MVLVYEEWVGFTLFQIRTGKKRGEQKVWITVYTLGGHPLEKIYFESVQDAFMHLAKARQDVAKVLKPLEKLFHDGLEQQFKLTRWQDENKVREMRI